MTFKKIFDRVALQAGLPILGTYAGSTNRTALEMVLHCSEAGEEITRRAEWSQLYSEQAISSGASSVALPVDFHRLVMGRAIAFTNTPFTPVLPVPAADAWDFIKAMPSSQPYFFIRGGSIEFSPALTADATLRYISKNWIAGKTSDEITDDAYEPDFSGSLLALGTLWRYKRAKGVAHEDVLAEFEAELAREIAADRGRS